MARARTPAFFTPVGQPHLADRSIRIMKGRVGMRRSEPANGHPDQIVKREIEIPHHSVVVEDGMLCSNRSETDFVRAMTHELRTPLNVIIGLCQILERDRKTPLSIAQRDAIDRMERNARSLLQSVNHLLACVRNGRFE